MIATFTPFDIIFPLGLGAMFGLVRYSKLAQAGAPDAARHAAFDGLKAIVGAGLIVLAYKSIGIL